MLDFSSSLLEDMKIFFSILAIYLFASCADFLTFTYDVRIYKMIPADS